MEKYYFDSTDNKNKGGKEKEGKVEKITLDYLKEKVLNMDVYAEVESKSPYRATVMVHKDMGTTMYMAGQADNYFWLQKNSVKSEAKGSVIKYHFVLD